jgi:eukaryotic-like serine/threonine-protein kinase
MNKPQKVAAQFEVMQLVRVIERGGFGRVEEVLLGNGVLAARKVFDPQAIASTSDEYKKLLLRFKKEAKTQSLLDVPRIVTILQASLDVDPPSYLMPLAQKICAKKSR